jgi:hypothetical protein
MTLFALGQRVGQRAASLLLRSRRLERSLLPPRRDLYRVRRCRRDCLNRKSDNVSEVQNNQTAHHRERINTHHRVAKQVEETARARDFNPFRALLYGSLRAYRVLPQLQPHLF